MWIALLCFAAASAQGPGGCIDYPGVWARESDCQAHLEMIQERTRVLPGGPRSDHDRWLQCYDLLAGGPVGQQDPE